MTTKLAKHSPAPWEIAQYEDWKGFSIWAPGAGCIAERWYASEHEDAPILANARLIKAAPDMLQALEDIAETLDKMAPCPEEVLDKLLACAQSAIRAAVGAQEENTQ